MKLLQNSINKKHCVKMCIFVIYLPFEDISNVSASKA